MKVIYDGLILLGQAVFWFIYWSCQKFWTLAAGFIFFFFFFLEAVGCAAARMGTLLMIYRKRTVVDDEHSLSDRPLFPLSIRFIGCKWIETSW